MNALEINFDKMRSGLCVEDEGAKKRILHCAYSGLGGHAAVLFTLLNEETSSQFEHFVLFFGVEDLSEEYTEACDRLDVPFSFVKKRGRIAFRSHRQVMKVIREVKPDVVMMNGTSLAIPLLSARSLFQHTWAVVVRETQANHLKTKKEWVGSYVAARLADAVVYLTREYRDEVEKRFLLPLRRRGQVHLIPNGVDTDRFTERSDSNQGEVVLAMVSRLVPIKDHSTLIDAVRILVHERDCGNLKLFIAGDGPTLRDLGTQAVVADLEEHVVLAGMMSRAEVDELLGRADIYVHCTFGETMSNSILQAMAARLPVVASDVQGVSNMIHSGVDGLLVPVENPEALADALEELVCSPEKRRALGSAGYERIEESFSQRRMASAYRTVFASVGESLNKGGSSLG